MTTAKIVRVRYSGGNWLCDVEVNGRIYDDVMVTQASIRSGDKNLMLKDVATRLYDLLNRDKPVTTPIDGEEFEIEEAKDYIPPTPEPDPVQQKKTRLQQILGPIKDRIKRAIEDGLITTDDQVVQNLIEEARTLIQEIKEAGENPFE